MELAVSAWGQRRSDGWRGGIRIPHPRSGAILSVDLTVPRSFAEDVARQFSAWFRELPQVSGDEVGFLPQLGQLAAQLAPQLLPGLVQGAGQLLGGLFGGQRPQPPPSPQPPPQAPPPQPPTPPTPPLPGLAGLLGAGLPAPDLLGSAQVLAAVPRFSQWSPALERTLRTAIRIVDAEAGRRIGDPRARAALAEARRSAEERVIRALRLVDAMLER